MFLISARRSDWLQRVRVTIFRGGWEDSKDVIICVACFPKSLRKMLSWKSHLLIWVLVTDFLGADLSCTYAWGVRLT